MSTELDPKNKTPIHVPNRPNFSAHTEYEPTRVDVVLRCGMVGLAAMAGYVISENVDKSSNTPASPVACEGKIQIVAGESGTSDTFEHLGERYVVSSGNVPNGAITKRIRSMNPGLEQADIPGSVINLPKSCETTS